MRGRGGLATLSAATVILAAIGSFGAVAGHTDLRDADDVRGRLDVRLVDTGGDAHRPRWKVVTWGSWRARQIWDAGFVTINLDTFGTPSPDYYVLIGSVGTHLFGELWRDRDQKRDYRISGVHVWRPSRTSVSARIPLKRMRIGGRRLAYTWYVETLFTSDRCRRVCFDLVPDQGVVAEPLPMATPTPTPSPTPTVTTSPTPSGSPSP